ncbi:MAG TPA: heme ABC exporter ATP-binding protein CcmA [Thermoanaerobaculia bacterium]|jgi:heme exporter protein A|nr:heme ABC exporter ATP-binding protein CcmA [Thermoanaerobaculia bacterium]
MAVDAEHISRRFGRRWALTDISFQMPRGSVMMVAGPNGSGKSTLFRVLSTVIRADQGRASVAGFDVKTHRDDVRRAVAFLSHYSYLYESLTARENLQVAADHAGLTRDRVMPLLDRVTLAARADHAVSTFSAGMRKRLSFARVLLQDASVVMLDEPYAQLDPDGFALVDDVVRDLKSRGTTVLIATHQIDRAQKLADAALFLDEGRVRR